MTARMDVHVARFQCFKLGATGGDEKGAHIVLR
jgi:hypothetical protein